PRMSGQKRPADSGGPSSSGGPPEKRREKEGEEGGAGVSSAEEQDIKALQAKNRKLGEALDQRQVIEDELRERIERLETRQATDDASLLILNRYWNQASFYLTETQNINFASYICHAAHQGETSNSFLATLASSTSEEMEAELQERVESSQKQAQRVVDVYENLKSTVDQLQTELDSGTGEVFCGETQEHCSVLESDLNTIKKAYIFLIFFQRVADQRVTELQARIEELQWDMEKIRRRENRLNAHLSEILERVNSKGYKVCGEASSVCGTITINKRKFEEMNSELEENRELAENRLIELQKLQQDLQNAEILSRAEGLVKDTSEYRCLQSQFSVLYNESLTLKAQLDETRARLNTTRTARLRQLEHMENDEVALQRKVRTEVFQLEDTLAQVKKEYEMLRIEFEQTLAANEQAGPINREMRHLISTLQTHNQQLKGEVVKYKLRLRETQAELNKVSHTEVKTDSDLQVSPAGQMKLSGYLPRTPNFSFSAGASVKTEPGVEADANVKEEEKDEKKEKDEKREKDFIKKEEKEREREKEKEKERERPTRSSGSSNVIKEEKPGGSSLPEESAAERISMTGGSKRKEMEQLKIIRAELKKAQESQREMKLLLDMYRSAPKEQRDKVQLMAAEKKTKSEAEELRQRLRELEERERREGKKMADEEALRKIRSVEEQIDILNKKLSIAKQEEDALLSEMDVTGQAFEDMQEQNIRLMQQLREKDDANFKLMSERIKSNQIHKLLKEEKEELADQLLTLKTQVDAQLQVVRKLEEKERLLQGTISAAERELTLRTQALDMNKRKAQDSALMSDELRAQLEQVQQKLKLVREEVVENSISREKESFNARRAQEDISKMRRKIEKAKKPAEKISNGDDILNEEINEYKARLTCPCCNSRVKDAVLTKCFHVFCFECVKTRYDTRQRKCPKCNAAFGANDFHRIYIG
uniref:E3 ubiquitin protein ligase n=1 Tax=Oryzias sinensis TaxID=183150 RepID=A0A8C7XHU5_9TELE